MVLEKLTNFRNTKIGDPAWHLLNCETNKKNNNMKLGLHFQTAEQAIRKEKEREKASWLKEPKEYNHPRIFFLCDTRVHSIHSSAEKT